ncbi:MAG TPA: zinc ribbon domain-containing protein [Acidobacteriaceae bacterium]|nr:zinc ribbon domain-containing protein [Acidobacteriaceae bacterium]
MDRTVKSRTTPPTPRFSSELKLVPLWSVVLAAAAFVGVQYLYWIVLPEYRHHAGPPVGLRLYFAITWSALAALYMLMIGYVSNDAPRRHMSAQIWMLICFIMPAGVGSVLYFLLRQPIISGCPACGTPIQSDYHFCPQCACQVSAACGNCYRSARPTDLFCVHCGHDLASDSMPERVRSSLS